TSVRLFIGVCGSWVRRLIIRAVMSLWLSGSLNKRTGRPALLKRSASICIWVVLPTPSGPSITMYLPLVISQSLNFFRHLTFVSVGFRQHHIGRPSTDYLIQ